MMAGIVVDDDCVAAYMAVWKRKARYVIYAPNEDNTKCVIEKQGDRNATFDEFKENVPKDQGRWILYDHEWKEADGRKVGKSLLIAYSPDANTDATQKFVIPNSLGALKAKMDKVNLDKQINSWDDLSPEKFESWFQH